MGRARTLHPLLLSGLDNAATSRDTTAAPPFDVEPIRAIVDHARSEGRSGLLEPEARAVLAAIGIASPRQLYVHDAFEVAIADLDALRTERVAVKVVAPGLTHKSDVGGVAVVRRDGMAVAKAVRAMAARLDALPLAGFTISEFVDHETNLGAELLVSVRWTSDFGPILSVGAGGVHAEALAADLRPGREIAILAPALPPTRGIADLLARTTAVRVAMGGDRGVDAQFDPACLVDVIARLSAMADAAMPDLVSECEINPVVLTPDGAVALDVVIELSSAAPEPLRPRRPVHKLRSLLEPESIAIIGVSERLNLGHIVLCNLIRDGFDAQRIFVVKPGADRVEGCACVPDIAALPRKVDLFVVAVSAEQAPGIVRELIERDAAQTVILIPGGLGETTDSAALAVEIQDALAKARRTPGNGPLVNGGNCLGIRSRPGRYDTMFIPAAKLEPPRGTPAPVAIVAQSGGFAISRLSRLEGLEPKYVISVGNQLDLTVSDYLAYLGEDPDIGVYAVYVEGFAPLDGIRFMTMARELVDRGRTVILYRAGRTTAGARAAASHTASMAGDMVITRELASQAGVVLADSLADFDQLTRTFTLLHSRRPAGRRVGAVSNAGYECVAIADAVGGLELPPFEGATAERLYGLLDAARVRRVVDLHNPLDLTPIADDAVYEQAVRAVLEADTVDIGVVGIVPFTAALQTLPVGIGHIEDIRSPTSIAARLASVWHDSTKPWVAVVDAGARYDPLAAAMGQAGIPVFRTADAAMRAVNLFCWSAGGAHPPAR